MKTSPIIFVPGKDYTSRSTSGYLPPNANKKVARQRTFAFQVVLYSVLAVLLCCSDLYAENPEAPSGQAEKKDYLIDVGTENREAADFLTKIITPIAEHATDKFKDLEENGEELPMNIHDPTVDCREYDESLYEYDEKITNAIIDVTDIAVANNNELGVWGKLKALNILRLVFQYAILERPFTPGYCLDKYEAEFLPRLDALMDDVIAQTNAASPEPDRF